MSIGRTKLLSAVLLTAVLAGCGPGSRFALATLVANRDGAANTTLHGSVMIVDSPGSPYFEAAQTSLLSASAAPSDKPPLNVCRIYDDITYGASISVFTLLDPGNAFAKAPGDQTLQLSAISPESGTGTAMTGAAVDADFPFEPGQRYRIQAEGSAAAPGFAAEIEAPQDFTVDRIGISDMSPGTIDLHRTRDLDLIWSPGSDADFYVVVTVTDPAPASMVCRLADTGEFTVKSKVLEKMPLGTGQMFFERIFEAPFKTQLGPPEGRPIPGRIRFSTRWTAKIEVK